MLEKFKYIAIDGVMDCGKTIFSNLLANQINANLVLDKSVNNPYLYHFYENFSKYAFATQVSFLIERIQQHKELFSYNLFHESSITNYFFDKNYIYSKTLLNSLDFNLYRKIYNQLVTESVIPDLIIFFQVDVNSLYHIIQNNDKYTYEKNITLEYLKDIQNNYMNYLIDYNNAPVVFLNISLTNNNFDSINIKDFVNFLENLSNDKNYYSIN